MNNSYIFTVIALGHLGDTILVEPLCRNIRYNFPNSKIIMIVSKPFKEIAMGFESVNEVFSFDKENKHKGILGCFSFAKDFPYKKLTEYAIITHPHERSVLLAKAIKAKNIISLPVKRSPLNLFINNKRKYDLKELKNTFKADFNSKYLSEICNWKQYPVRYIREDVDTDNITRKFNLPPIYTVLSPSSKDVFKDWDYINVRNFIKNNPFPTVLVGTEKANKISERLKKEKLDFIDLTNKTTISELGAVIKSSDICVSVDTGTFHLSYAQKVKTIGLFFNKQNIQEWVPKDDENITILQGIRVHKKNYIVYTKDINAEDVIKEIKNKKDVHNKCMSVL